MRAILPAAGLGTRMAHLTGGGSKEMLKVKGLPVIMLAILEAREAGADRIIVVSSPSKPDLNQILASLPSAGIEVEVMMQEKPIGLGPAVAQALGAEPCLVLLPDSFFAPSSPCRRLADRLNEGCSMAIAFRKVPDDLVGRYGIAVEKEGQLVGLVEKPAIAEAPSRLAVNGRYAFSASSSLWLREWIEAHLPKEGDKEMPLTTAIQELLNSGVRGAILEVTADEQRHDCGSPEGYRLAKETFG